MKLLILDNYDSFTYNLLHYFEELVDDIIVKRNDEIALSEINIYDAIVLSPGPGLPQSAGIMPELIKKFSTTKKILGVCLGMQAIGEAFGGKLYNLEKVLHGVSTQTKVTKLQEKIFKDVPQTFETGHYHSWAIDKHNFPEDFEITAENETGIIMAISHKQYNLRGVQFHPESVLTPMGFKMLKNWVELC
jgi:anthranilate synthase component II